MANLAGSKILMVIAPNDFRDEELLTPRSIFMQQGAKVVVASTQTKEAKGMLGAKFTPDIALADCDSKEFNGIVVVGGMGSPQYLWDNGQLHKIIQEMDKQNKVVAAICLSGAALAKAGVLKGKKATVWADAKAIACLKDNNAHYTNEHVVTDGHIVTADGPEAAEKFAYTVASQLANVASKI